MDISPDKRFGNLPLSVMSRPDLKTGPKVVYAAILMHDRHKTGKCNPGITLLAQQTALSRRTVIEHLEKLRSKGLIEIHRGRRDNAQLTITDRLRSADSRNQEVRKDVPRSADSRNQEVQIHAPNARAISSTTDNYRKSRGVPSASTLESSPPMDRDYLRNPNYEPIDPDELRFPIPPESE